MTTTAEERALFILKVLDTAQWNVFPSEEEIETLSPYVDQIRDDYEDQRGRGFHGAFMASRAKFIAQALHQAQNDKLEEAALWFEEQAKIVKGRPYLKAFPASLSEPICEILDGIPADLRDLKSKD